MIDLIKKEEKIEAVKKHQQFNVFTRWFYKIGGACFIFTLNGVDVIVDVFKYLKRRIVQW